jgi:hypothetical protein
VGAGTAAESAEIEAAAVVETVVAVGDTHRSPCPESVPNQELAEELVGELQD